MTSIPSPPTEREQLGRLLRRAMPLHEDPAMEAKLIRDLERKGGK
jgi:hypothetical protein